MIHNMVAEYDGVSLFCGIGERSREAEELHREGHIGRGSRMIAVICLIRPERLDALLEAAFAVVERHIGVVSVSDAKVLRAERF
ncbi:transcriptional regulator [Aurantimonas sp. A2-1-M11]|uniref:transcriptional regulator n=1 Tax=Aurantimonas sp. A2-1-M11 TaxID=3113712 RepID=UPI002F94468C